MTARANPRIRSSSSAIERGVNRCDTTLRSGWWRGGSVWIIGWIPNAAAPPWLPISAALRTMIPSRCEL